MINLDFIIDVFINPIMLFIVALLTIVIDHVWRDKRTNIYKNIRRSLFIALFLLMVFNVYTSFKNKIDKKEIEQKSIILESPSIAYRWDSNYRYYAYYPVNMATKDRAEKLKSKFEIYTFENNVTDFNFSLSFSFNSELYSEAFVTVPSIPLINWSPQNVTKHLEQKAISFDIYKELRNKGVNLVALFPFEDLTLQKEKEKFNLPSAANKTPMSIFEGIDGTPPFICNNYRGLFLKATVSYRANNIWYTHYVIGRIAFGFPDEKNKNTKAMWVSDFFTKPEYCSVKIGSDHAMVLRIFQAVYNTEDLLNEARPDYPDYKNAFMAASMADTAGNWDMEGTWFEEINNQRYYKKHYNLLHNISELKKCEMEKAIGVRSTHLTK